MKSRLPWIISAMAVAFAVVVFIFARSELKRIDAVRPGVAGVTTGTAVAGLEPVGSEKPTGQISVRGQDPAVASPAPMPDASPTPGAAVPAKSLKGTVVDSDGSPVRGAAVTAVTLERGGQSRARVEGVSGENGSFEFTSLHADHVEVLRVEAAGFAPAEITDLSLPADGVRVTMKPLGAAEIQIFVATSGNANPVPFTGEATIYVMRRRSVDAEPARGAVSEPNIAPGQFVTIGAEQAVIAAGRHLLRGFEAGIYKVAVIAGEEYAESEPFKLESPAGGGATVVLGTRQGLSGFVKSGATQQPVESAEVALASSSRPLVSGGAKQRTALTGPDGLFEFGSVIPGVYTLTISASGHTSKTVEEVTVPAGAPAPPATYFLSQGTPSLTVSVSDSEGKPVAGAALVLISMGGSPPRSYFGRTDSAGRRRFDPVQAGRHSVAVTMPDSTTRQKSVEVVVGEGEAKEIMVQFSVTVRVMGTVQSGGQPYQGLLSFVARGSAGLKQFAKCDGQGSFQIELEPGDYVVGRGDQPGITPVKIPQIENVTISIDLK